MGDDKEVVLYLACCGGYMTVNACQKSPNCTPKKVNFMTCTLYLNFKIGKNNQ